MLCKPLYFFLSVNCSRSLVYIENKMETNFHLAALLHYSWKTHDNFWFNSHIRIFFLHNWNSPFISFIASFLHRPFLQTVSIACLKSTNEQNIFFLLLMRVFDRNCNYMIWSMVEYCFLNPHWLSLISVILVHNT